MSTATEPLPVVLEASEEDKNQDASEGDTESSASSDPEPVPVPGHRESKFTPGWGPAFINLPRNLLPTLRVLPDVEQALCDLSDALHMPGEDFEHCWVGRRGSYTPEQWQAWKQKRDIGYDITHDVWSSQPDTEFLLRDRRNAAEHMREAARHIAHAREAAGHMAHAAELLHAAFECLDPNGDGALTLRPPFSLDVMPEQRRRQFLGSRGFWYERIPERAPEQIPE